MNSHPIGYTVSANFSNRNGSNPSSASRSSSTNQNYLAKQGSYMLRNDSRRGMESSFPTAVPPVTQPSNRYQNSIDERKEKRLEPSNKGIVGLRNLGNTCYMNSILQCVARLQPLIEALRRVSRSDINTNSKLQGKMYSALNDFINEIREASNQTVISPYDIKSQIGRFNKQFSGYDQQDSSEFFRCLLDALSQDLNRVKTKPKYEEMTGNNREHIKAVADRWWDYSLSRDSSLITDIFQGQFYSVISCKSCGYGSLSFDSFLSINLPSPESAYRTNIEDALDIYLKESHLPSSYKCEKCRGTGNCSQKISIFRFPKVLVLQVKRFQATSMSRTRLNTEVKLREELNMDKYRCDQGEMPSVYYLKGISHHTGTLYFGHYIAECKENGTWYCFDDSRAHPISPPTSSTSAYLLFYVAGEN